MGYPRTDIFFDKKQIYENYKNKFNLGQYDKVFVYCPTFRDFPNLKMPFSENFLTTLNNYLKEKNYIMLLKGHYWGKSNLNLKEKYSNIIDVSKNVNDIQDLFVFTDIIISDYSSIFFDFVLQDRPIIFYCYDYNEYLKNRKFYYDYYNDFPGPFAKNEDELLECIKTIDSIFKNNEYKEKYYKFKNRFNHYKDGKSCERLLNFLKSRS